ncbi:hypothetical protein HNQ01_001055 [Leptothrix sp. C29]|uniref:Uncharacterized protein n=1 Tax=Sphaerotilus uruguayifluvii TaxID=2735897 RepID=A0ABX2FZY8_9BURK|nr:hypothetical protein [Leptothrix sp. C29]
MAVGPQISPLLRHLAPWCCNLRINLAAAPIRAQYQQKPHNPLRVAHNRDPWAASTAPTFVILAKARIYVCLILSSCCVGPRLRGGDGGWRDDGRLR